MEVSKGECILYIEINKKVPYKIVRKIDIKNETRFSKLIYIDY